MVGVVRAETQDDIPPDILMEATRLGVDPKKYMVALQLGIIDDPAIARQYANDPMTGLSDKLIGAGTDTSPVQGGIGEGLARVAQGISGGLLSKRQRQRYENKQNIQNATQLAALQGMRGTQQDTGVGQVAGALTGPPPGASLVNTQIPGAVPQATLDPTLAPGATDRGLVQDLGERGPARVPRGQRAVALDGNNPGGLNDGEFASKQPGYVGNNGRYAAFDTPENGLRAQQALLRSYVRRGYDTPLKIAKRWAPSEDGNNPGSYAQTIANQLNISVNGKVSRDMIGKFSLAQAHTENSRFGSPTSVPSGSPLDPQPGSAAQTGSEPSAPPVQAVPELPQATPAPERPKFAENIRSARMELVDQLLSSSGARLDPSTTMRLINRYLPEGLTEEQDIRKRREEDERGLLTEEWKSGLRRHENESQADYAARIADRVRAITNNDTLARDAYLGALKGVDRTQEQEFTAEQNRLNREADLAEAQAKGTKLPEPPVSAKNAWTAMREQQRAIQLGLKTITDNPDAFGAQGFLGPWINNKLDPKGTNARSIIFNQVSAIIKERAGTAMSGAEQKIIERFLPGEGDNAHDMTEKLKGLDEYLKNRQTSLIEQYGKEPFERGTPEAEQEPTPVGTAAPKRIVEEW